MTRPTQSPSMTERLRADILSGECPPGTRLVELRLTQRYGVGRSSIRSAILELVKEGLVVHVANRGATVRALTLEETIEVYEVRARLEGLLARSAAQNASKQEREALRSLIPGLRDALESGGEQALLERERAFYEAVARIARHRLTSELLETLRNQSSHRADAGTKSPDGISRTLEAHLATIEAIVSGDPDAAEEAASRHIESVLASLR